MTEFKNETFVYLNREDPRVELHPSKWPFALKLVSAGAIMLGLDVVIKKPRILEFPNWTDYQRRGLRDD